MQAVQHVKRMRGGAQSHMMRADDGNFYIVKFQNNPQHRRVLADDFFATRLAARVGLPVPIVEIVEVDGWLVEHTSELTFQLASSTVPCEAGLQFGSRYVVDPLKGQVLDYLPEAMVSQIRNVEPSPEFSRSTSGRVTLTVGRRRSGASCARKSTRQLHRSGLLLQRR